MTPTAGPDPQHQQPTAHWPVKLTTERLRLRPVEAGDLPMLRRLLTDVAVREFLGGPVPEDRIEQCLTNEVGKTGHFTVTLAAGEVVGRVTVDPDHRADGRSEISYAFLPEQQGYGFAREAVAEVLSWVASVLPAEHQVGAVTQAANSRSRHLLRRLGLFESARFTEYGAEQVLYLYDPPARTGADRPGRWRTVNRQVLHDGPHIRLLSDTVAGPHAPDRYEHIAVADAVRVVALDDSGSIVLVEDEFYLPDRRMLHLPGGGVEPGEDLVHAAARELEEETGLRAARWEHLGVIHPLPSCTAATTTLLLATGIGAGVMRRDTTEVGMTMQRVPLGDALARVLAGQITEAGSVAAILHAHHHVSAGSRDDATHTS
ncbi:MULTISPECIES: GNAT family N-acetyltransferase [unclassified Kitasatospora]|uniref:GNAT family N-acetyltransferase n=1 Tax=unclassified Kitasatospora TaxID=2633591 RepID=UPI00070EC621|nr:MULTISPECIES: GNAT family N-acetyltransferase [unclassified Kitasatospora]KQV20821.1 hypothetical protein ASC99_20135 [Kitasatospora sp. Root107]KRB60523.1 hypothetical protein ASE03_13045 [Kitasatospora sp. Root187]